MGIILTLIIVIFLSAPYGIDCIMGKYIPVMDREHWFGFLGSYLGGGITALITLFGIYWQLNETNKKSEKENKEGVFEYLKYVLDKNENIKFKYEALRDSEPILELKKEKVFFSVDNLFIEENAKIIFSEKKGKQIASLFENMNSYNDEYIKYLEEYIDIENRIYKMIEVLEASNLEEDIKNKYNKLISRGKLLMQSLNTEGALMQSYIEMIIDNSQTIEGLSTGIRKEIIELTRSLNDDLGVKGLIDEKDLLIIYNDLKDMTILKEKKMLEEDYEKYLIKLFLFEKKIFDISTVFLVNKSMGINFISDYFKFQNKVDEYFILKVNLLRKKAQIINEKNKISFEISKILTRLRK